MDADAGMQVSKMRILFGGIRIECMAAIYVRCAYICKIYRFIDANRVIKTGIVRRSENETLQQPQQQRRQHQHRQSIEGGVRLHTLRGIFENKCAYS